MRIFIFDLCKKKSTKFHRQSNNIFLFQRQGKFKQFGRMSEKDYINKTRWRYIFLAIVYSKEFSRFTIANALYRRIKASYLECTDGRKQHSHCISLGDSVRETKMNLAEYEIVALNKYRFSPRKIRLD